MCGPNSGPIIPGPRRKIPGRALTGSMRAAASEVASTKAYLRSANLGASPPAQQRRSAPATTGPLIRLYASGEDHGACRPRGTKGAPQAAFAAWLGARQFQGRSSAIRLAGWSGSRHVEIDAFARIDVALAIERQMQAILGE